MAAGKGSGAGDSASAEIGKYLDILAKDPSSRVFAPLAEAYRKAGLLDDAIATAFEGLKVHPNYLGGRVALGRALFEKKRYAEAADELRKVVRAAPDNIIAHRVLGQVALAQGSLPDAEKAFRMVALLDPHDQEAKKVLADIGSASQAPEAAPPAPSPPPPVVDLPWREMTLETSLPMEGLPAHRFPAEESLPSAPAQGMPEPYAFEEIAVGSQSVDLEEPDEAPPAPIPEALAPEPGAVELPVLDEIADEEPIAIPETGEPVGATAYPAAAEPEAPMEIEFFGREPGGVEKPAPLPAGPEPEDAVFEVFTREPRRGVEAVPRGEGRGERSAFEELVIEPTAHLPPDLVEGEPPVIEQPEETPRIDVLDELQLALERERPLAEGPTVAAEPTPAGEEIGWEEESPWQAVPAGEEETAAVGKTPEEAATEEFVWEEPPAPATPEVPEGVAAQETSPAARDLGEPWGEPAPEPPSAETIPAEELFSLEEESPGLDPAGEIAPEATIEEATIEEATEGVDGGPVEESFADLEIGEAPPPSQPSPEPSGGRGIFDTETLATIYINQGFYGRAAAIYERLAGGSPDDAGLRRKLEEVRALERAHGGQESGGASAGEPAAAVAGRHDRAETVRRLEALLEAFRRGRPR